MNFLLLVMTFFESSHAIPIVRDLDTDNLYPLLRIYNRNMTWLVVVRVSVGCTLRFSSGEKSNYRQRSRRPLHFLPHWFITLISLRSLLTDSEPNKVLWFNQSLSHWWLQFVVLSIRLSATSFKNTNSIKGAHCLVQKPLESRFLIYFTFVRSYALNNTRLLPAVFFMYPMKLHGLILCLKLQVSLNVFTMLANKLVTVTHGNIFKASEFRVTF